MRRLLTNWECSLINRIALYAKKIASKLPLRMQQEMKKWHFGRKIKKNVFCSDEPEFFLLEKWVMPGSLVLDIGANVGHYTIKLSQLVGGKGRVIAFEPVPATFELLVSNVAYVPFNNTTLLNCAASSAASFLGFDFPEFDSGLSNYYMAHITDHASKFSVLCLPVDCLELSQSVSLVKVDVEGHEYAALSGVKKILRRDHPIVIAEGFDDNVTTFMTSLGYQIEQLPDSPNRIFYCGDLDIL